MCSYDFSDNRGLQLGNGGAFSSVFFSPVPHVISRDLLVFFFWPQASISFLMCYDILVLVALHGMYHHIIIAIFVILSVFFPRWKSPFIFFRIIMEQLKNKFRREQIKLVHFLLCDTANQIQILGPPIIKW